MNALEYTPEELNAIRQECAAGASDSQFTWFLTECQSRNLVPGRHIVFQTRRTQEYDATVGAKVWVAKPVLITTIPALRLIAQRSGEYQGQGREKYIYLDSELNPTIQSNIPLPNPANPSLAREPWVAEATVYRKGFLEPMVGVARFEAYASTQKTASGELVLTKTWSQRNCEQLSKCAEALALRKAFPEECSGLLISEELKTEEPQETPQSVAIVPDLPVAPKVDHTPAVGTDAPRPGEIQAALVASLPLIETKPEEPKKRGRKPKTDSPVNGQPLDQGITQEDIDNAGLPAPVVDEAAAQREAKEFVEAVTSFTEEEAAAQGLPAPEDPIPNKEQLSGFTARLRALIEPGVTPNDLRPYFLQSGDKTDTKYLTVGDWGKALGELEAAKAGGTLKDLVKK